MLSLMLGQLISELKTKALIGLRSSLSLEISSCAYLLNEVSVLPKENEKIWFTNKKVIKFSSDKDFITKRVAREKILKGFVPEVTNFSENMYVYEYVEGDVLSKKITKKPLSFCIF